MRRIPPRRAAALEVLEGAVRGAAAGERETDVWPSRTPPERLRRLLGPVEAGSLDIRGTIDGEPALLFNGKIYLGKERPDDYSCR